MKQFFEQVRKPNNNISFTKQITVTAEIILLGLVLGVVQKLMDEAPTNAFLDLMQMLDVGNCFLDLQYGYYWQRLYLVSFKS